jgi:hypothetical protein
VTTVHVFVSFDLDHDNDCKSRFVEEGQRAGSYLVVDDWSIREVADDWREKAQKRISNVDLMFVICGEHADRAANVNNEVALAREVGTPYLLLAGRSSSSTKPHAALDRDRVLDWKPGVLWAPAATTDTRGQPETSTSATRQR